MFPHYSASHNFHPTYRPDIDGLRAIAILSVLIFHAFPESMKGGYVGVDVFFVISGYLISSIIFRSLHRGDFSFYEFYAHRVNRIFPALIVVSAASYVFGYFALFPDEYKQLGKHMSAGAGFVENFVLWKEAGYFDAESVLKPMMHLWSLSIEEQYYLIYPLLIWGAWRLRLSILTTVVLLCLFSFALNVQAVDTDTVKAFFSPQTRFWELLVGALLAYTQLKKRDQLEAWLKQAPWSSQHALARFPATQHWKISSILSVVGLALIVVAIFGINKNKQFPGWWALIPVLGAFLLILSGPMAWVNRKVLARRGMVFIGLISYPLYLWHWPILSFAKIIEVKTPSPLVRVALVFVSILLAWLTYRFVEKPLRFGVRGRSKTVVLFLVMLLVMGVGYMTYLGRFPWQLATQKEVQQVEFSKNDWAYPPASFTAVESGKLTFYTHDGQLTSERTLFLGDSNLAQYGPRIEKVILEATEPVNGAITVAVQNNCDILGSAITGKGCELQIKELIKIAQDENIKKLVIAASWGKYRTLLEVTSNRVALGDFIHKISSGKQIYIVKNIPVDPEILPPDALINRHFSFEGGKVEIINRSSPIGTYESEYGAVNIALQQIATGINATLISPTDYWCTNDLCPSLDEAGFPLYMDNGHITASFSRRAAIFIDQTLTPSR